MKKLHSSMQLCVLAGALAYAGSANAASVYITNAGFEDPVLADGVETWPYNVPGWVEYEPTYAWEWEAFNPSSAIIAAEAHSGSNVVMTIAYDPATQYLEQTLTNTLQPNTRYTLSAWMADPEPHAPPNSASLLLYAGAQLLGTGTIQPVAEDTWTEGSLVFETGNSHPQLGQTLKIRIMFGANASYRMMIDDVSLDATNIPPVTALYTWDGSVNNWNTPHWNPGAVVWPGAVNEASVTNGTMTIPDASGAFQAVSMAIAGGTVSVTGDNGYSGVLATTMTGGTLSINGVSSTLGAVTLSGGTLAGANPSSTGSWQLSTDVNVVGSGTSTISAPQVALGDAGRIFAVAATATLKVTGTLRAAVGSEGLVKKGTGTMILASANTYDGATMVNAGTLVVSNTIGSATGSGDATVANGGTLAGSGQIAGSVTVQGGGTLAPGNSIGTMVISNLLTLSGSTVMEVAKTAGIITNDLLRGMTSVSYGGSLFVNLSGEALAAGDSIKLFDAGSFGGSFAIYPGTPGADLQWDTTSLTINGILGVAAEPVFGSLFISNGSFEDPVLPNGANNDGSGYTVPGWVEVGEPTPQPYTWYILNPGAERIPEEARDGANVLVGQAWAPTTSWVEQTLTDTLKLNTRYTLSVWVADPDVKSGGTYINNVQIFLYAGATSLGGVTISPTANDAWTKGSFVYASGVSNPDAGQPLKILIMYGDKYSYEVFVDDVSLTAVPMFPNIWSASQSANRSMTITATGETNQNYSVITSTNLTAALASWTVLGSGTVTNSPFTINVSTTNGPQRFYSLKLLP